MVDRWGLRDFLKRKNKFMTEKEIIKSTKTSQPSINKKLNSLVKGRTVVMKKKLKKVGNRKMKVKHYKFNWRRK